MARGQTDWARAEAMTGPALEESIAADLDEAGLEIDWSTAVIEMPRTKTIVNLRLDQHVLDLFKQQGRGYQTRINAVLRAFVEAQAHRPR